MSLQRVSTPVLHAEATGRVKVSSLIPCFWHSQPLPLLFPSYTIHSFSSHQKIPLSKFFLYYSPDTFNHTHTHIPTYLQNINFNTILFLCSIKMSLMSLNTLHVYSVSGECVSKCSFWISSSPWTQCCRIF